MVSPRAAVAAANLRVDAVTVETFTAFREAGVPAILLKGPSVAHWLGADVVRAYGDCDLLVPPTHAEAAEGLLAGLGFEGLDPSDWWTRGAWMWRRNHDGAQVDLHYGLAGADAGGERIFAVLAAHTTSLQRARTEVTILDRPATAFVLALHAAHHGRAEAKPLRDLDLAVERFEPAVWSAAASLAATLEATPAFATGLRLLAAGAGLADDLALPSGRPVTVALAAASAPGQAFVLDHLAQRRGARAKAVFLARRLVPPAVWMRTCYPLARRGRLGLAAAHVWRLASAPARLAVGVAAWRRARRDAERSHGGD